MNKYDEMVVRITIFCREPLNFGLFYFAIESGAVLAKVLFFINRTLQDNEIIYP